MTDGELDVWQAYVDDLAELCELHGWQVKLHWTPSLPDDNGARVDVVYGRRVAHVQIGEVFVGETPDEQRHILVHELMHVLLWPIDWTADNIGEALGKHAFIPWRRGLDDVTEQIVDVLATALARHLPLPPR